MARHNEKIERNVRKLSLALLSDPVTMGQSPVFSGPRFSPVPQGHMRDNKRKDGIVVKSEALALIRAGFKPQLRQTFNPCGYHFRLNP